MKSPKRVYLEFCDVMLLLDNCDVQMDSQCLEGKRTLQHYIMFISNGFKYSVPLKRYSDGLKIMAVLFGIDTSTPYTEYLIIGINHIGDITITHKLKNEMKTYFENRSMRC